MGSKYGGPTFIKGFKGKDIPRPKYDRWFL